MDTSFTFVTLTPHPSPVVSVVMLALGYLTVMVAARRTRRNMLAWAER